MPSRSDKKDALTLAAHFSGLELEFIDGVNGSDVTSKAVPQVLHPSKLRILKPAHLLGEIRTGTLPNLLVP